MTECWLGCWFLQDKLDSDAVVILPEEEQQGDKLQVLSPPPKPTQVPAGQPLSPSTGELPPPSQPFLHQCVIETVNRIDLFLIYNIINHHKSFFSSPGPPAASDCNLCGDPSSLVCPSCDNQPLCDACDDLFHRHPSRANHKRDKIQKTKQGASDYNRLLKQEFIREQLRKLGVCFCWFLTVCLCL